MTSQYPIWFIYWDIHLLIDFSYQDPVKCSNGTYRDTVGATQDTDCIDCALGEYCASEGLIVPTGPCAPGFYCLRGNVDDTPTGKIIMISLNERGLEISWTIS